MNIVPTGTVFGPAERFQIPDNHDWKRALGVLGQSGRNSSSRTQAGTGFLPRKAEVLVRIDAKRSRSRHDLEIILFWRAAGDDRGRPPVSTRKFHAGHELHGKPLVGAPRSV